MITNGSELPPEIRQMILDHAVKVYRGLLLSWVISLPINAILTSCILFQAWYIIKQPKELASSYRKWMAGITGLFAFLWTIFDADTLYEGINRSFTGLDRPFPWASSSDTLFLALQAAISQAYFVNICRKLIPYPRLLVTSMSLLIVVEVVGLCFAVWMCIEYQHNIFALPRPIQKNFVFAASIAGLVLDGTLAALMLTRLDRMRTETSFRETKRVLTTSIQTIFETYLLTTLTAIIFVISCFGTFSIHPAKRAQNVMQVICFTVVKFQCRVYAISFLYLIIRQMSAKSSHAAAMIPQTPYSENSPVTFPKNNFTGLTQASLLKGTDETAFNSGTMDSQMLSQNSMELGLPQKH